MYKGGFGVSISEGLVCSARQIFHLMTQIQIQWQYENKYLTVQSYLLHLHKNILRCIHRTKKLCIYTLPDSNIIWDTIQETSYMHLNYMFHVNHELCLSCNQILTTGLHTIKSTTTKWNNLQLQATHKFHLWMSKAKAALYWIVSECMYVCWPVNFLPTHNLQWINL